MDSWTGSMDMVHILTVLVHGEGLRTRLALHSQLSDTTNASATSWKLRS